MNFSRPEIFSDWANVSTPKCGGVYKLLGHPRNGKYPVLYVGQSRDLQRRIYEHIENSDDQFQSEVMFFVYLKEDNKVKRDAIEFHLITTLKPPFNKQLNPAANTEISKLVKSIRENKERIERERQDKIKALVRYLAQ